MSFVHLHLHSQYSLLEATCEFESLCARAKDFNMPAVALTDFGNMFGAVEFYFAAKSAKIKPIIGLEVYLAPKGRKVKGEDQDSARMPNRRLVLLAMNYEGYQNLCKISSCGYQEGFYYRPRIDYEILEKYHEHLIVISGSLAGDVLATYKNLGEEKADARLDYYRNLLGDRFYLEINRTGVPEQDEMNKYLIRKAQEKNIKLVAANEVYYLYPQDQVAQEVLICIGSNKTLQDPSRFKLGSDQFYFKSAEQMREIFKDIPEACDSTLEIADRCNVEFKLKTADGKPIYHLPSFPTQGGVSLTDEIIKLSNEGLTRRFIELKEIGEEVPEVKKPLYYERLEYETKIINQMGFNGYFLIVQDFINWAKKNNVPVGPGRGSGAGSLVSYSLGITDINPMRYDLLFERFLNPERISMPDFDVDFCQENRSRVIDYVTQKYGAASVSQIITFGKLQAKAAIRDVGRVMGMTYAEVDVISKLIPEKPGTTLKAALEQEPRIREMMDDEPKIATLIELAQKIEGLNRHAGIHAAGVIIADGNIVDKAPLYRGVEGENVVQYDMKRAEKLGLIKFDFLGLKTLTHIRDTIAFIEKNRNKKIQTSKISMRDPGIYSVMCKGDTAGIFQFESESITNLIRKMQPVLFEELVAINALHRPGPMDMIPDYLDRRAGRKKVEYIFSEIEPILKETIGIVVYQEQVQMIAARVASYSLGEADILRRAMGKKDTTEMAQQKTRFLDGAKRNGFDAEKAEELFDTMARFAEYGFNKSHAAAYCMVAAYTAYLKHYYPVEFYAGLLSTEMSNTDNVVKYVKDARAHNIKVRPPHINFSEFKFNAVGEDIVFSLGAVKGVGEAAVEAILEARSRVPGEKFASLEQFFGEVDLRRVNKKTIESLVKAGALDDFGYNRSEIMLGYTKFIERSDKKRKDKEMGQESLFAFSTDDAEVDEVVILDKSADWNRLARLAFEKEVLGFYLSGHPLDGLNDILRRYVTGDILSLEKVPAKSRVSIAGLISTLKEVITKKGTRMAFANIEDTTANIELVIFPDVYKQAEALLKGDGALIISGGLEKGDSQRGNDVQKKNGGKNVAEIQNAGEEKAAVEDLKPSLKILVEKVQRAEDLLRQSQRLTMKIPSSQFGAEVADQKLSLLKEVLQKHPGSTVFVLQFELEDMNQTVDIEISDPRGVDLSMQFFESVTELVTEPKWIVT